MADPADWAANAEPAGTSAGVAAKPYTRMLPGRGSCPVTSCSRLETLVEAHPAATTSANRPETMVASFLRRAAGVIVCFSFVCCCPARAKSFARVCHWVTGSRRLARPAPRAVAKVRPGTDDASTLRLQFLED